MGLHYVVGVSRRWVWVFALLLFQAASQPVQSAINCTPAPDGLAAWWPAEDHSYDIIGKRFGVLNGDAAYTAGNVGRAFSFGGAGGRVRVLESTSTDVSRMARWTIEVWVRPASFANTLYPTIYSEGNRIVTLGIQNGTGRLESWVNNDNARRLFSTNALTVNDWNHVALVYEGGRRLLYLNGVLDGSTNTPPITDDGSGAAIGQSPINDATTIFQGAVDELSLYNVGLTAEQIAAIHAAGPAGKCLNDSPAPTFVLEPPASHNGFLGGTATFTALAAGCPDISYQWLLNGSPVAATNATGSTTLSLTLSGLTFANAGSYSLRATSPFGSATSTVCQLIVPWCTEPPTNLVAWWPADGSGIDATTNHRDGAVWGGTTYGPGVTGLAFCFNGTNAYAAVPDAPALSPHVGTNGEMTIEAWVKLDQLPLTDPVTGQNRRTIIAKGGPGQWEYGLSITNTGAAAVPEFFMWNTNGGEYTFVTAGSILPGQWHHIVATLKKGDAARLYQDGQLLGTSTNFTGVTGTGNSPLYIGRRGDAQFLKGWVDEAALYSRALTSVEVLALYAAKETGKCSGAPGPAPWFVRQPENQTGYLLLGAGLTAFANGTPRPTYQWYRSNATEWTIMVGQTTGALTFTNLSADIEGNYRVVATNPYGSASSESGYLRVVCHDLVCGIERFEKGWNGWTTDGPIWQVGRPTSGPGGAHSGTQVAATVLDGNYYAFQDSRLISPPLRLPNIGAGEALQLRYWEWFSYSTYDFGYTQISVFNPTNGQWGAWVDLHRVGIVSLVWSPEQLDIGAYAGKLVRLAFYHYADRDCCNVSESTGWYIDDVHIKRGPIAVSSISAVTNTEAASMVFPIIVIGTTPDSCVSYQLIDPPAGATIDPTTGQFSWTPEECQGPGVYNIGIYVVDFCNNEANDLGFVKVTVNEVNEPPWLLPAEATVYVGRTNFITMCSGDPDCPRNPLTYSFPGAVPSGLTIDANTGVLRWVPPSTMIGARTVRVRLCDGGTPNYCVTNTLTLGVTTNEYALEIQQVTADDVRFILHGGSMAVDYILQQAMELCGCECENVWEDVGQVTPTEMPYAFDRVMDRRYRFFRLRETPRLP